MNTKTVVFIHGMFLNPLSWKEWIKFFESKGFKCHAPAYPHHDGEPSVLRESADASLGKLTFSQVASHLNNYVEKLPEKPILIGHSMGGLAVQTLTSMNKSAAGVCIDSAPPKGLVSFKWSFLKANFPTINPLKGNSVFLPDLRWFQYAFCNTMTVEQTEAEYNRFVVPESRNIARTSAMNDGYIDFAKPHAPLLFIAGEKDNIIPSSLNWDNYNSYTDGNSKREFKEFPRRTHYICAQENWQEVADYIFQWINRS